MSQYVTVENDRLDRICKVKYGTERNGNVELVLLANPGLAELPAIYPAGLTLILPEITSGPTVNKPISLWT